MRSDSGLASIPIILFVWPSLLAVAYSQTATPSATAPSRLTQPFIHPDRDDVLTPGSNFMIEWTPNTAFSNITLELWDKTSWGYSRDFSLPCYHYVNPFCGTIALYAPNTGTYNWSIPEPNDGFPRGERVFWIKMYVNDYLQPDIGNTMPVLSYSQNFAFIPLPGQSMSSGVGDSSTVTSSTVDTDQASGTISTTAADGSSTEGLVAGTSALATATATGISKNDTIPMAPSQGEASRVEKTISAALMMLFGLL